MGARPLAQMQPMNLPQVMDVQALQDASWIALPDQDPGAEAIVQRYLKKLSAQGVNPNQQGIWLQSGSSILVNHQGRVPLSAASLTKVATTLAALNTWGPDHQFETVIAATGPIQNGVLQGDLVVQGGGDPLFVWEEAISIGHSLNQLGIRRVTGDLVLTDNFLMNFELDPVQSGQMLKQALNVSSWNAEIKAQYQQMEAKPPKPQVLIQGKVRYSLQPSGAQAILRHKSLPLVHLIKNMTIYSNNVMAETLSRLMGGPQVVVPRAAAAAGIDPQEIHLINGSGLGPENKIAPHAVAAMFTALTRYADAHGFTIADLFPIAGTDGGTILDRGIPRNSVVKTGTLNEVSSLAGVLPTRDRGLVWFTIINHGTNIEGLRDQQDQLLQQLQAYWGAPSQRSAQLIPAETQATPQTTLGAIDRNEIVPGG